MTVSRAVAIVAIVDICLGCCINVDLIMTVKLISHITLLLLLIQSHE